MTPGPDTVAAPGARARAALSPLAARLADTFPTLAGAPVETLERIAQSAVYRKVPAGTVISQVPEEGVMAAEGSTVRIVISAGAPTPTPSTSPSP
jgi:hypothetical protein